MHVWIITRRRFGWGGGSDTETLAVVQGDTNARRYLVEQGQALGCDERVFARGETYLRVQRVEFEETEFEVCSVGVEVTATRWEVRT
jgi:hypothetical protein